ncbi:Cof-type HAD-IIB family hydrolase [Neobacillus sp. Marseille-QA0830]
MRLIAIDMDGTTLNSQSKISQRTVDVIKKAQEQGHIVAVMSGRHITGITSLLYEYGIECPIGTSNGNATFVEGKMIDLVSLDSRQNEKILYKLDEEFLPYKLSTIQGVFAPKDWETRFQQMISSEFAPEEFVKNDHYKKFCKSPNELGQNLFQSTDEILGNPDMKVQNCYVLSFIAEQTTRLKDYLSSIDGVEVTSSLPIGMDILHSEGNKGHGLEVLAEHFHIPLEDTIAIGDEQNDIPMFKKAGLAIAMGNAHDQVKELCDAVTLTNDEDGVAYAIEKYVLNV